MAPADPCPPSYRLRRGYTRRHSHRRVRPTCVRRTTLFGSGSAADFAAVVEAERAARLRRALKTQRRDVRSVGPASCGAGWHLRPAFATRSGRITPARCLRGAAPTRRIYLRPRGLPGYKLSDPAAATRRAALALLLDRPDYERVAVRRRLLVLALFMKRSRPALAAAARADADWVAATYGRTVDWSRTMRRQQAS